MLLKNVTLTIRKESDEKSIVVGEEKIKFVEMLLKLL